MLKFNLFGTTFRISYYFVFICTFLFLIDRTGVISASFLSVLVHEMAHIIFMKTFKVRLPLIEFSPGVVKISSQLFIPAYKRFILALSGPFVNVICGVLVLSEISFIKYFGISSLTLGLFNLMPIKGLDGGDALLIILSNFTWGEKVFSFISLVSVAVIIVIGGYIFLRVGNNPMLLLCGVYLLILSFRKI